MTGPQKPDEPGKNAPEATGRLDASEGKDLARRSRALEEALAAKKPAARKGSSDGGPATGGVAGIGQAFRLSSEFIAGIAVGAGLGWLVDNVAGTSPWGLIILLLLGFAAGVLNVLRAADKIAEPEARMKDSEAGRRDEE